MSQEEKNSESEKENQDEAAPEPEQKPADETQEINSNEENENRAEPLTPRQELVNKLSPKLTPVKAAFIGLVSGFLVFQIFTALLSIAIVGTDIEKADPNVMRLLQTAGQILFMLLPALLLSKLIYDNVTELLRVRLPDRKGFLLFILSMVLLIIFLQNFMIVQQYYVERFFDAYPSFRQIQDWIDGLNKAIESSYLLFFKLDSFFDYFIIVFVVAIVPSLAEEVMFRGYIQRSFELRFHPLLAAAITAFFFSIFHVNPSGVIGLFFIGLFLGFAAYKSDSILVPVVLHFINNFAAILLIFIYGESELITPADAISKQSFEFSLRNSFYMGALFIASIFAIQIYYKKHGLAKNEQ